MTAPGGGDEPGDRTWKDVCARRRLEPERGSVLTQLLAADGFDICFGVVREAEWKRFAHRWGRKLGLDGGASVFEVGCGAGAFLYPIAALGCRVGGIDQLPALIEVVRSLTRRNRAHG